MTDTSNIKNAYSALDFTVNKTGDVQNNAALCASVTAKGSGTLRAARIYGYPETAPASGISNNYAKDTMRVGTSAYSDLTLTVTTTPTPIGDTQPHGATVDDSGFYSASFWTSASYLNFSAATIPNTTASWNFTSVTGKGYPTLTGVGGQ